MKAPLRRLHAQDRVEGKSYARAKPYRLLRPSGELFAESERHCSP
jgi:hypothetical protein